METSSKKVHALRRGLFCRLLLCRSLGGNLKLKQATNGYTPFRLIKMKKLFSMNLLLIALIMLFASCNKDESRIDNPTINDKPQLTILTDINELGDFAVVEDTLNYAIWRTNANQEQISVGCFNGDSVVMQTDSICRPVSINCGGFSANITYRADKAFLFCKYADQIYSDTISINQDAQTRAISNGDILTALGGWVMDKLVKKGIAEILKVPVPKIVYQLLDYQRATIDMGLDETLNYQIEQYNYIDWLLRPHIENIPEPWLKKIFEYWKKQNIEEIKKVPTITIGLQTGNAPYVYNESAICLVDGYLRAIANEGSFDFDYGICYSEKESPTISDFIVSKNIKSGGLVDDITLALPEKFILSNLKKNTKYYYRAFYKDRITNTLSYCETVRNFKTSDIPASISSFVQTNSYHSENGYENNGKNYKYQYKATLKAEIASFDDILDWGYFYINEKGNRVAYSLMNRNSLRCDDILTFYSNESETIVKIGCYVKYSSKGDVAFYSDPQDYKLIYNDNVKLSFTGCKFITITHDNSLGYYRCGVTFEASFKIQGGEKLTSVIIVPFGNFLTWNSHNYENPTDGDFSTTITDQYLYEYGLHGNFYCYLLGKDVNGNEYYSDNIIRLYHDGYHFTECEVQPYESLTNTNAVKTRTLKYIPVRH